MSTRDTFTLQVRISPEEVLTRLKRASVKDTDTVWLFQFPRFAVDQPLFSRKANRFRIQKCRHFSKPSGLFLYAQIEPSPNGSLITGHFGMNTFARVFITIWFTFLGIFSIFVTTELIYEYLHGPFSLGQLVQILPLVGMGLFAYLMILFGKYLTRNDPSEISEWMRTQLADVI